MGLMRLPATGFTVLRFENSQAGFDGCKVLLGLLVFLRVPKSCFKSSLLGAARPWDVALQHSRVSLP